LLFRGCGAGAKTTPGRLITQSRKPIASNLLNISSEGLRNRYPSAISFVDGGLHRLMRKVMQSYDGLSS